MLGGDVRRSQSANHSPGGILAASAEESPAPRIASAASAIALTAVVAGLCGPGCPMHRFCLARGSSPPQRPSTARSLRRS
jgi:hypothetical protein